MTFDAIFSITLWLCVPAGMLALIWWELRNGRVPASIGFPAKRAFKPYLFWSQLVGQAFATLVACCIVAAVIVAATGAHIRR